ncbi:hypothetical protein QE379_001255 [Sphingomonas sp. SORGH_AS 879]|nr:hypothetical protein [Sphingomonas sp. SORGH_AS_0879]
MIERADPGDSDDRRGGVDLSQHGDDILRHRAIHLADEAQGQVKLVVILPPGMGNAVHDIGQPVANGGGRAKGDEQADHDKTCLSHSVAVTGTSPA